MKVTLIYLLFLTAVISCKRESTDVTVEFRQSVKIDLKTNQYITFYLSKKPAVVNFKLSDGEQANISSLFKKIEPFFSDKTVIIEDKCATLPKPYTTITDGQKGQNKKLIVDFNCQKYRDKDVFKKVEMIEEFVDYVYKTVASKPGIKNVPDSDIFYY